MWTVEEKEEARQKLEDAERRCGKEKKRCDRAGFASLLIRHSFLFSAPYIMHVLFLVVLLVNRVGCLC